MKDERDERDERGERDDLLDRALASYSQEPLAGIEYRVLARVRAEAVRPVARWWIWAGPAAVCGCLLLAFAVTGYRAPIPAPIPAPIAGVAQVAKLQPGVTSRMLTTRASDMIAVLPITNTRRKQAMRQHSSAALATAGAELPKLDVFPSPAPLTPQDETLASFAAAHPQQAREALATPGDLKPPAALEIKPIQIAAIEIKPLVNPEHRQDLEDKQ